MSAAAPTAPVGRQAGKANPWLIALLVALASFMEVLDTTVANVVLPYIGGSMGVSQDEASWVVTTYLVANAIILVASPFLAGYFGRKRFFLSCLMLFTLSSLMCGLAWNLDSLLLFRVMQGFAGGGMVPVAQSILADAFPPEKRSQGFAMFGIAVVVAPVVGPTLGGWIADNWSWHWCFFINMPVGLAASAAIAVLLKEPADVVEERKKWRRESGAFDYVGFALVATFLSALEVTMDRGLQDDWFGSNFIIGTAVVCAIAFVLMIPWELNHPSPAVDIRMVATRQFGACFVVMLATGGILMSTTQVLPQLVQTEFGYTATWAGLVLSPGGVVTMCMMLIVGRLAGFIQPRWLIMAGAAVIAVSMHSLTQLTGDVDFWYFADTRLLLGVGLPLIFLPLMSAAYFGLAKEKTDQASALLNAARNVGGSIGISMVSNIIAHREQFHQSRLVENTVPSNIEYQSTLKAVTDYFVAQGSSLLDANKQAIGWIGNQVTHQAALLSYIDAFWVLMWLALASIPLAVILRNVDFGGAKPAVH